MELTNKVCIITGGASGIGQALCERFAAEGAAAVVVADKDAAGAAEVAKAISASGALADGAVSTAAGLDVSSESSVKTLVSQVMSDHGRIDVFVSNAGFVTQGGLEVSNETIQQMWEVHVLAHVYAARAAIPHMAAAGGGYLLNTASAAGLLTQLGSMQYSITKAAAVSLGEWLAITYGGAGIKVSMLCPQAVKTNIMQNSPDREGDDIERGSSNVAAGDGVLAAAELAEVVVETMREERFLVLPHPEVQTYRERKASDIDRWLSGMERFQSRLYAEADSGPAGWFLS